MKNHWLDKKKNETPEQAGVVITGDNEWVLYDQKAEYIPEEITVSPTNVGDITICDSVFFVGADPYGNPICISGTPFPPEIKITSEIPKEIKVEQSANWDWNVPPHCNFPPFDFGKCEVTVTCPSPKVYTRTLKLGAFEFKDDGEVGFDIFVNNVFTGSIPYDGEEALFNWMKDKLCAPTKAEKSVGLDDGETELDFLNEKCWIAGKTISPSKVRVHYDEPEHLNICKAGLEISTSKRQLLKDIQLLDEAKKDIDSLAKAEIDDAIIEDIKQNVGIIIETSSDHHLVFDENDWPTGY